MDYDFTKRERDFGRIVFALVLDKKKLTERIIIGETMQVHQHLKQGDGDIYYDRTRPLGQMLLNFEADPQREWNINAMLLHESYSKIFPFEKERWKMAEPSTYFLQEKYNIGEPTAMFAAMKTWEDYLNCYNLNHGAQLFLDKVGLLYRPFFLYGDYTPWQEQANKALSRNLHDGESQVELWYPVTKRPFECVVAHTSLQPLISYYLHKIEEWNFSFQECKVCGKYFLARNKHYELCSDGCRKVQAVEAKRQFDDRAKGDRLEQLHESAYYYWYNRLRKIKRAKPTDTEKMAAVTLVFEQFRAEAKRQKTDVKHGKLNLTDFSAWIVLQEKIIDDWIK